jgi:membrane protein implicated in regulation of membrane protease activity
VLIAGHVINLVLLLVIFLGTQYLTQAQGCDSAASFRWAIIAAAVYGLISAMALRRWYHSNSK